MSRCRLLMLVVAIASGCAEAAVPTISPVGIFVLRTVNDQPLPVTIILTSARTEVLHDTLAFADDGSCQDRVNLRFTPSPTLGLPPSTSRSIRQCTWTRRNAVLELHYPDLDFTFTAELNAADTLIVTKSGQIGPETWLFTR